MFDRNKNDKSAIDLFLEGIGKFVGVSMIVGLERGINITVEEGKVSDTILNALSNLSVKKLWFAYLVFF